VRIDSRYPGMVRRLGVVAAAAGLCTALAACSSSKSGGGATGGGTSGPAHTSSGGATQSGSGGVPQQAVTFVDQAMQLQKPNLQPLANKPPTGKSIINVTIPTAPPEVIQAKALEDAAKLLGWTTSRVAYKGDPATLKTALKTAIDRKPTAVVLTGVDPATIKDEAKLAADNNVLLVDVASGTPATGPAPEGNGVIGVASGPDQYTSDGKAMADWLIKDSGGKAHAVFYNFPSYQVIELEKEGMKSELANSCPACTLKVVPLQLSDVGTKVPQTAVGAAQSDHSINYMVFPFAFADNGVLPALKTAGFSKIKITISSAMDSTDFAQIKAGTEAAGMYDGGAPVMYGAVDCVARYLETKKTVNERVPSQLFDRTNLPAGGKPDGSWLKPFFQKLWKVQ